MRYRVIGAHPVLGNKPGEEFTAELPRLHEHRLLSRGAIERVKEKGKSAKKGKEEDD